ncbi:MAG: cytochrome b/b6 domain-containing protein [Dehalococcoidia bacterium]|jgi:formate dehydrogenase subunit gamma|nr:cytochrome b/b6 domain-containing protein [Dehalococcoidia bacterium]
MGPFVPRFTRQARALHWSLAAPVLLLLLTGLTNFAPELKAVRAGDVRLFAWLHVVLGFATLAAARAVYLPLLLQRALRDDLRELMDVRRRDYLWLQHIGLRATGAPSRPPSVGKFNAGQKLNTLATMLLLAVLLATGAVLGINYFTKRIFDVGLVETLFTWHTALSLLAVPLILGHLYLALLHPSTRESLRGVTRGAVRRDWAERHHDAWAPDAPAPAAGAPPPERTPPGSRKDSPKRPH